MANDARGDRLQGLGMLASALAGRPVAVAELQPGEPPWTDGQTIYVDPAARARAKLEALKAVAVQASMIAAGSLDPDVVRPLVRHPRLARRYLAVEGHRALVTNGDLLPGILASVGNRDIASRSDSPAASLSIAAGTGGDRRPGAGIWRDPCGEGAGRVLPSGRTTGSGRPPACPARSCAQEPEELEELDDGEIDDSDDPDLFTSPVGGGGFIGKWLKKMLSSARKTGSSGGGPPGADTPTHRTNSVEPRCACRVVAGLNVERGPSTTTSTPTKPEPPRTA